MGKGWGGSSGGVGKADGRGMRRRECREGDEGGGGREGAGHSRAPINRGDREAERNKNSTIHYAEGR